MTLFQTHKTFILFYMTNTVSIDFTLYIKQALYGQNITT